MIKIVCGAWLVYSVYRSKKMNKEILNRLDQLRAQIDSVNNLNRSFMKSEFDELLNQVAGDPPLL